MAYDSDSDRVILFGGRTDQTAQGRNNETWSYDLNTNAWTNMTSGARPSVRIKPAMAYDEESDRVVLFGGLTDPFTLTGDTWAYDFNTNTWTDMAPALAPPIRVSHSMAYNAQWDRIILFGGLVQGFVASDETWAYDFNMNTWTNLGPASGPSARWNHDVAYDSESDRLILFGGSLETGVSDETWAFDLNNNTWTNTASNLHPSARPSHLMAYDSESDRVILFGGSLPDQGAHDDTWAYDFNNNTWTNVTTAPSPSTRSSHALAYDSESDRVVLFGGVADDSEEFSDETWLYSYAPVPPGEPQDLQPVPADGQVDLSWRPPISNGDSSITAYRLFRGTTAGGETFLTEVGAVTTYTDTAVVNGQVYYYQVSALNSVGEGPRSNEASATPVAPDTTTPTVLIISPVDGASLASTSVTVSGTASDDVGVDKVELSTDGITWGLATGTASWSGTVTLVEGPNTIFARATDTSGNTATVSIAVTVDTVSPIVSITSPANGSNLASPPMTVSGTASDDVALDKVEGSTDAANWVLATGTMSWFFYLNLTEGDHTIFARATDTSGNTATVSIAVTVDTTNPTVAITSPADGANLGSTSVTVSGTASDNGAVEMMELSLDGTNYVLATGTTSWSGTLTLAEGPNTVFARATDTSGNTATVTIGLMVDTVSPIVSISSPADGSPLASTSVVVFGTASDNVALAKVELSTDAANWVLATGTTSWSGTVTLVEGPNTIYARATDAAGTTATVAIAVTVDTANPTVAITSPADGANLGSTSVTVSGTASDDVGVEKVELSTDGTNWILATGTMLWSGTLALTEGPNTIFARATDTSGNANTLPVTVTVDTVPPSLSLTTPADGMMTDMAKVIVSGTTEAGVSLGVNGFGVPVTPTGSFSFELPLAEGANVITAKATDAAGNVATVSVTVTVDTVKPTAVPGADQRGKVGDTVSFDASGSSDDVAVVSYEWDFGDGKTGTGETTTHTYSDPGTYTVTLTVRDAAGNADTDVLIVTVEAEPLNPISPEVVTPGVVGAIAIVGAGVALLLWRRRARGKRNE